MYRKSASLGTQSQTHPLHDDVQQPVGQNCISSAPLFSYSASDFIYDLRVSLIKGNEDCSKFEDEIISRWEDARERDLMNYDLNCLYKLLDGDFNLSVQLNVERGEKRRKPMHFRTLREPFNNLKWNFTKLKEHEILFNLQRKDFSPSVDTLDYHFVAINASPLTRGHSLLLPCMYRCAPQILSEVSIRLATDTMLLARDSSFHVLFNSLLAMASINHLHLHLLTWPYDSDLINRKCEHLFDNVYIVKRPIWFTCVFVFQLTGPEQYEKFVMSITRCADYLNTHEVAHNMFFSRAQPLRTYGAIRSEDKAGVLPRLVTAYIFPRISVIGAKPAKSFNPASLELSGCLSAYTYQFFEAVTEKGALRIIDEEAGISVSQFNQICAELVQILSGKASAELSAADETEPLSALELDELRDSFQAFETPSQKLSFRAKDEQFTFGDGKLTNSRP